MGHSVARLQKASSLAVDALVEIVKDKEKPSSVRVMSARSILDFSNKGGAIEENILSLEKLLRHGTSYRRQSALHSRLSNLYQSSRFSFYLSHSIEKVLEMECLRH